MFMWVSIVGDNEYIKYLILISNFLYLPYSLNNAKNECSRNVIFQLLFHIPPIQRHILDQNNNPGTLTTGLRNLFTIMQSNQSSIYTQLLKFLHPIPDKLMFHDINDGINKYNYNKLFSTDQGMSGLIVIVVYFIFIYILITFTF